MKNKLPALLVFLATTAAAASGSTSDAEDGHRILEGEIMGSDSLSDAMNVEDYDDEDSSEDIDHRNLRVERRLNVNCHACKITCEWYDFDCHGEKIACWSTGAVMKGFLSGVEAICNNDSDRMKARALVNEAVQILVDKRLFSANELNSAKIRFCSALKVNIELPTGDIVTNTIGMAPSRHKVLIHTSYIHKSAEELAVLLAHEYTHIRQYARWGTDKFNCLYSKEVLAGKGTGKENWVEEEAYDFENKTESIIHDDILVTSNSGVQVFAEGKFQIGWDITKRHNSGTKTRGAGCHPGCKRHSFTVTPDDPDRLACGGERDTRHAYWASNDETDCRLKIPFCRHNVDSSPCRWEIEEICT